MASSFGGRWRGPTHGQGAFLVLGQGTPDWLIKVIFLEEAEQQLAQAFSLGLALWAFSKSDAILGMWFSL